MSDLLKEIATSFLLAKTLGEVGVSILSSLRHCERSMAISLGQVTDCLEICNLILYCIMVFQRGGCVYIMTNKIHSVIYVGVTSDIIGRVWDHKNETYPSSFTAKYECNKLVYYEFYPHIEEAIAAEKNIKAQKREKKIILINSLNSGWKDLYDELIQE